MSIRAKLSFITMSDDVHLQDETKTRAWFSGDHGWQWRRRQECAHTSGINYQIRGINNIIRDKVLQLQIPGGSTQFRKT